MPKPRVLRFGELTIDLERYQVLLANQPLALSSREYALLVCLATQAGQVVSKRQLVEEGFGLPDPGGIMMVDERIRHLKSQLEREGQLYIEHVEDIGYRFVPREGA